MNSCNNQIYIPINGEWIAGTGDELDSLPTEKYILLGHVLGSDLILLLEVLSRPHICVDHILTYRTGRLEDPTHLQSMWRGGHYM